MNTNMKVATVNADKAILVKKFENDVKEFLTMTTEYTTYFESDDDNFKVEANYDYVEIQFHGNQITFYCTGEVKACLRPYEFDVREIGVIKDIMDSDWEVWMMYDSVFNKSNTNNSNNINN